MAAEIKIMHMTPSHLDKVMEVEHACFTMPWSEATFYKELTDNPYALYIVATCGDDVAGYAGTWLVLDEAHITNVGVSPKFRRKGIGQKLMDRLLELARRQGALRVTLEVRKSNMAAQALYSGMGFKAAGVRRGYYTDNNEDAIIMWLDDITGYLDRKDESHG